MSLNSKIVTRVEHSSSTDVLETHAIHSCDESCKVFVDYDGYLKYQEGLTKGQFVFGDSRWHWCSITRACSVSCEKGCPDYEIKWAINTSTILNTAVNFAIDNRLYSLAEYYLTKHEYLIRGPDDFISHLDKGCNAVSRFEEIRFVWLIFWIIKHMIDARYNLLEHGLVSLCRKLDDKGPLVRVVRNFYTMGLLINPSEIQKQFGNLEITEKYIDVLDAWVEASIKIPFVINIDLGCCDFNRVRLILAKALEREIWPTVFVNSDEAYDFYVVVANGLSMKHFKMLIEAHWSEDRAQRQQVKCSSGTLSLAQMKCQIQCLAVGRYCFDKMVDYIMALVQCDLSVYVVVWIIEKFSEYDSFQHIKLVRMIERIRRRFLSRSAAAVGESVKK